MAIENSRKWFYSLAVHIEFYFFFLKGSMKNRAAREHKRKVEKCCATR